MNLYLRSGAIGKWYPAAEMSSARSNARAHANRSPPRLRLPLWRLKFSQNPSESHFYSNSAEECAQTLARRAYGSKSLAKELNLPNKLNSKWLYHLNKYLRGFLCSFTHIRAVSSVVQLLHRTRASLNPVPLVLITQIPLQLAMLIRFSSMASVQTVQPA